MARTSRTASGSWSGWRRGILPCLGLLLGLTASGAEGAAPPATGTILPFAGNGHLGYWGDWGVATSAYLAYPKGMAVDGAGNVYIADSYNNRVRKVAPDGTITTFAGTGAPDFSGEGGQAADAALNAPMGVAVDAQGRVYIADTSNHCIRRVDGDGRIWTVAGTPEVPNAIGDDGPAAAAYLNTPYAIAIDASGNLYIADTYNFAIRRVDHATGWITRVAGNFLNGSAGDGGPANEASISWVYGLAVAPSGAILFADAGNHAIFQFTVGGDIGRVAGNGTLDVGGSGNDGPATVAGLALPTGVAVDDAGTIFIAENYGSRIRKVQGGIITLLGGTGGYGLSGDGLPAVEAELGYAYGLALEPAGHLLVSQDFRHVVRRIWGVASMGSTNQTPTANAGPDQGPVEAGPGGLATVTLDGSGSTDPDQDPLSFAWSWPSGSETGPTPAVDLPIGVHTLTLTVTDGRGGSSTDTVDITVEDTTPPTFTSLTATPSNLWPANRTMQLVTLTGVATDLVDPAPTLSIQAVAQSETDTRTPVDWEVAGDMSLLLRAESNSKRTPRIYTITVRATDRAGNFADLTVDVTVSKPRRR